MRSGFGCAPEFVLLTLIALPVTAFAIYCLWRGFAEHRIHGAVS
ncbi:hypothetical protein ACU4GD_34765 [Cupriavidus basilensis]